MFNLLSCHRGGKIAPETERRGFVIRNRVGVTSLPDPPGDVEERETNAVFDEDGEVFHIQHGVSVKGDGNRQVARTRERLPGSVRAHLTCRGFPAQPDTIPGSHIGPWFHCRPVADRLL